MAQKTLHGPGVPRLIFQDGQSSRYNSPLTKQEIEIITPVLQAFTNQGVGRERMLEEASRRIKRPITMAQIDRLRSKLGLLDRQKSGSRNHSSNFSSSTSSIIAPPPSESVTSLCGAPIDGYMDINSSEDTNPGVAESWIRAMDKEDILEGERMETQTPSSNTGRPGTLLAVMKPFVDSEIPKHLEICVSPTLGSLPRIGEGFANRRKDAVYRPSRLATGLYMAAVTDTTLDDQLVPRLNQTALVLHTLRAFDQAFDVFLTIFGHLRQSQADSPAQQFQVVVAAINCARSARTRVHREVAREILEEVRHRLALYLGVGVIEHTNIWMYLTHLHCELAPKEAGNLVESLPVSLEAQIAHWTVTASCCRNGLVHEPPNVWDHLSTQTVRQVFDDALAHIRNCERSRDAITDSLRTTLDYVEANSVYLDILLDQHWGACGKDGSHIAQAISCLIFEDHLERCAVSGNNIFSASNQVCSYWFPQGDLDAYALLDIPFVLVSLVLKAIHDEIATEHDRPWYQLKFLQRPFPPRPMEIFRNIAIELLHDINSALDVVVVEIMHLRAMSSSRPDMVQLVPRSKIFAIAAAAAELLPISDSIRPGSGEDERLPDHVWNFEVVTLAGGHYSSGSTTERLSDSMLSLPRSSTSSGYRSFRHLSRHIRDSLAASFQSQPTKTSSGISSHRSWRLSAITGLSASP